MKLLIFFHILICLLKYCTSNLIQEPQFKDIELVEFARKVYLEHCKNCRTTLIITDNQDNQSNTFLKSITNNVNSMLFLLLSVEDNTNVNFGREMPDLIIYFLNENSNISSLVLDLSEIEIWRVRAKHLFVMTGKNIIDRKWLEETFGLLWEFQVLRVLFTFMADEKLKIFSHNPFLSEIFGIEEKSNNYFMEKITNMWQHPIKFYSVDGFTNRKSFIIKKDKKNKTFYLGLDGLFLGTFVEALNASIEQRDLTEDFEPDYIINVGKRGSFLGKLLCSGYSECNLRFKKNPRQKKTFLIF